MAVEAYNVAGISPLKCEPVTQTRLPLGSSRELLAVNGS